MDLMAFITGYRGKNIPQELKEFNWGAFLLTFIWGIRFKAWVTLLAIPLMLIHLPLGFNWILFVILQLYCGFKGNEWAYQVEWWKKYSDFRKTQARWAIAGVLINITVPIVFGTIISLFVQKSPDNPSEYVRNIQCTVSYKKLQKGITHISPYSSGVDMADSFSSQFKNSRVDGDRVIFTTGHGKNLTDTYIIAFSKFNMDTDCNFINNNCMATSMYALPDGVIGLEECVFYFDNHRNIQPNESTKKALQKGLNIFNYL